MATFLLVKTLLSSVFAVLLFCLVDGNPLNFVILLALVVAAITYLLGDRLILPNFGNVLASVVNGLIAALIAFIFDFTVPAFAASTTTLFIFFFLTAVGDFFYHQLFKTKEAAS